MVRLGLTKLQGEKWHQPNTIHHFFRGNPSLPYILVVFHSPPNGQFNDPWANKVEKTTEQHNKHQLKHQIHPPISWKYLKITQKFMGLSGRSHWWALFWDLDGFCDVPSSKHQLFCLWRKLAEHLGGLSEIYWTLIVVGPWYVRKEYNLGHWGWTFHHFKQNDDFDDSVRIW